MKITKCIVATLLALVLACSLALPAMAEPPRVNIAHSLHILVSCEDTELPIPNATVILWRGDSAIAERQTNAHGFAVFLASFSEPPVEGYHDLRVTANGFLPANRTLSILVDEAWPDVVPNVRVSLAPVNACTTTEPPTDEIFSTGWASTWYNWLLFFLGFGFIWMWFF